MLFGICQVSCYQSQNYKIWKQFTTFGKRWRAEISLLSIAKLQNLKAIHNDYHMKHEPILVVINRKTTKFESNSQRYATNCGFSNRCYQSQNYKIWKQFTTMNILERVKKALLSIAKLQNLKAIHNCKHFKKHIHPVVINRKTTKFESNSQRYVSTRLGYFSSYQSQNYKIWKQFTTVLEKGVPKVVLLSIAKIQNLKTIHNILVYHHRQGYVVINRKTTKFESNLQLCRRTKLEAKSCYQSQNYKIWKQFTTWDNQC